MWARSKTIDKNRSNACLYKGFIPYNSVHCIKQTEEPRMFYKRESIPDHLKETIKKLDEQRLEIEKQSRLSAKINKLKNQCYQELRFMRLKIIYLANLLI